MADPYLIFEPLGDWPYPATTPRDSLFQATWSTTKGELLREATHLGTDAVVIEVGVTRDKIRRDGQLRADTRLDDPRVRVSMDTRHGPLRLASDRYRGHRLIWQHNVRAVVVTLEALRTVERHGAVRDGQQYAGFLAIEAGPADPAPAFASADAALRWMRAEDGDPAFDPTLSARQLYRGLASRFHPDVGGDRALWDRLQAARRLLEGTALW